jgi:hypothetical protein
MNYRTFTIAQVIERACGLDSEGRRQLGLAIRRESRTKGLEAHEKRHLRILDEAVFRLILEEVRGIK